MVVFGQVCFEITHDFLGEFFDSGSDLIFGEECAFDFWEHGGRVGRGEWRWVVGCGEVEEKIFNTESTEGHREEGERGKKEEDEESGSASRATGERAVRHGLCGGLLEDTVCHPPK